MANYTTNAKKQYIINFKNRDTKKTIQHFN